MKWTKQAKKDEKGQNEKDKEGFKGLNWKKAVKMVKINKSIQLLILRQVNKIIKRLKDVIFAN